MDHARSFDFCQQLPRKTITEVHTSDGIYAHQVLLNETWENYCNRRGKPERAVEEHEKWVTETWDEYLARAVVRARTLAAFDVDNNAKIAHRKAADDQRAEIGNNVVAMMMAAEKHRIATTKLPCEHSLLLDFEELRQQRFSRERLAIEDEETAKRHWIFDEEDTDRSKLINSFIKKRDEMIAAAEAKRLAEAEARRRAEEERRLAEEKRKAEEDAKRRTEQEAERKRRAEEEEAKRAERKRKEDERRVKAKAEREARNKAASVGGSRPVKDGLDDDSSSKNPGRVARIKRMHDTLSAEETFDHVRSLVTSSQTSEQFCDKLVKYLGNGNLFFHTCVYVGQYDAENDQLHYIAASENSSEKLRSGTATLTSAESPTLSAMIKHPSALPHFGPMPCTAPLVSVGSLPNWPPDSGEAAFFPVFVSEKNNADQQKFWGVIAIDTAQNNNLDPEESFRLPDEAECYIGTGDTRTNSEPVSISKEMTDFLDDVTKIVNHAVSTLPSAKSGAGAPGKLGNFDFDLDKLRGASSLGNLLSRFSAEVRRAMKPNEDKSKDNSLDCYISFITSAEKHNAAIVSHNGHSLNDQNSDSQKDPTAPHHLVGAKINENPSAKTFNLPSKVNSFYFTEDVSSDASIVLYDKALNKTQKTKGEPLLLIPIVVPKNVDSSSSSESDANSRCWGAVGISGPGLTAELVPVLVELFWGHVRQMIIACLKRSALTAACSQALEWLSIATGVKNCYISFTHARDKKSAAQLRSSPLEIVDAIDKSQRFLIGQVWNSADGGVSHPFLEKVSGHTHEVNITSKHYATLENNREVKFFNDDINGASPECETAQLLLCSISQNKPDSNVHGILYGDTLRPTSPAMKNQTISASDIEIFRLTAEILAATLDGEPLTRDAGQEPLALEKDLKCASPSEVAFLTRLFQYAADNVRGLKSSQLTELSRYPAPPPVIPTTVASALILLGSSKQSTEWADVRSKIKDTLKDKILKFDPTSKKVKKACVVRSKKLTTGLTASDVFTKGSHPASCLFTWVFISLLLRKFAKSMRDRESDENENISAVLNSGGTSSVVGSSTGGDESSAVTPREDEDNNDDDDDDGDEGNNNKASEGENSDEE